MSEEVEYIKTPAYAVLEGNKIVDAKLGYPSVLSENIVIVKDMKIDPATVIGKFYDPDTRRAYINYDPRSGGYDNLVPISHEDDKAKAVEDAEMVKETVAANWMVRFIDDIIAYAKPVTLDKIPSYVTSQIDRVLGDESPFNNTE